MYTIFFCGNGRSYFAKIEDILKKKDFLFRERETRNHSVGTGIKKIEDVLVLAQHRNFEKGYDFRKNFL